MSITEEKIKEWEGNFWDHMYESGIMDGNIDKDSFDFIPKSVEKLIEQVVKETEQKTKKKIYRILKTKEEFVNYKKDSGHGIAVSMEQVRKSLIESI